MFVVIYVQEDGRTINIDAADFHNQSEEIRNNVVCPVCRTRMSHRRGSERASAHFFGSHSDECEYSKEQRAKNNGIVFSPEGGPIIVDFNFGGVSNHAVNFDDGEEANLIGRTSRSVENMDENRSLQTMYRLSSLLHSLLESENFRNSNREIRVGHIESTVRDFFIPFSNLPENPEDIIGAKGYYGEIREVWGGEENMPLWLKIRGSGSLGIQVMPNLVQRFLERYRVNNNCSQLERRHILVIGRYRRSRTNNQNKYVFFSGVERSIIRPFV